MRRNKVLSVLVSLSMVAGLCPSPALAEALEQEDAVASEEQALVEEALDEDGLEEALPEEDEEALPEEVEEAAAEDEADGTDEAIVEDEDVAVTEEAAEDEPVDEAELIPMAVDEAPEPTVELVEEAAEEVEEAAVEDEATVVEEEASEPMKAPGFDSAANAKEIKLAKNVSGELTEATSEDWYKFKTTKDGFVAISFSNDSAPKGNWKLSLYADDGTVNVADWVFDGKTTGVRSTCKVGLPKGTYYLRVWVPSHSKNKWPGDDVTYTVKVNHTADDNWEQEPADDSYSTPTTLRLEESFKGTTHTYSDVDWYSFSIVKDGDDPVTLTWGNDAALNASWDVSVYDDSHALVKSYTFTGAATKKLYIGKGDYLVRVKATENTKNDFAEVPYSLKVVAPRISIAKATISKVGSKSYTGKKIKPKPTVKLKVGGVTKTLVKDVDYTLSYKNNKKVGTATITVKGRDGYTGTKTLTFKIKRAKISKATVSGLKNKTYNGKARTQSLKLKNGKVKLKKGTDYTLAYANNVNVGKATITITGKGNYTGTTKVTFKVKPVKTSLTKITAKSAAFKAEWKKKSGQVSGYQLQYSVKKDFSSATKVKVSGASKTKKTVSGLDSGETYYVRVRTYRKVNGKSYYSSWSKAKKITVAA